MEMRVKEKPNEKPTENENATSGGTNVNCLSFGASDGALKTLVIQR